MSSLTIRDSFARFVSTRRLTKTWSASTRAGLVSIGSIRSTRLSETSLRPTSLRYDVIEMEGRGARDGEPAAERCPALGVFWANEVERFAVEQGGVVLRPAPPAQLGRSCELVDPAFAVSSSNPVAGNRAAC